MRNRHSVYTDSCYLSIKVRRDKKLQQNTDESVLTISFSLMFAYERVCLKDRLFSFYIILETIF
jgi:peroxiredoxin